MDIRVSNPNGVNLHPKYIELVSGLSTVSNPNGVNLHFSYGGKNYYEGEFQTPTG